MFYLRADEWKSRQDNWWDCVLGVVGFSLPAAVPAEIPAGCSGTPQLDVTVPEYEVWRASGEGEMRVAKTRTHGPLRYRQIGEFIFGCTVSSRALSGEVAGIESSESLRAATEAAYSSMFEIARSAGARILRVWNQVPAINQIVDGDERYRHFNAARRDVFDRSAWNASDYPAASAVGSARFEVSLYFLAACGINATMIENPRQVSAYRYPSEYGRHAPIFSRACCLQVSQGVDFFLSGTASIVGHETSYPDDPVMQTRETLANIRRLLDESNRSNRTALHLDSLQYKVYVRNTEHLQPIRRELTTQLPPSTKVVYLHADICRADLLLEIEAAGRSDR